MKIKTLSLIVVVLLANVVFLRYSGPRHDEHKLMGGPAPPFELSDLEGRTVSLAQFRGKIVMLDFWATWCGPCRISMPILDRLQKEFSDDMVLLAVNLREPRDIVRDYVARQNVRSRVVLDLEGNVGEEYESESIPMQVIIDQEGVVQHVSIGVIPGM